jgi:hypothetical protein
MLRFIRSFLSVIIGCCIVIPILFIIAVVLVITGIIEKIFKTEYSYKIAKYLGDDAAELLKKISGIN